MGWDTIVLCERVTVENWLQDGMGYNSTVWESYCWKLVTGWDGIQLYCLRELLLKIGYRKGWDAVALRELLLNTVVTGGEETKTQGNSTNRVTVENWLQEGVGCSSTETITVEHCGYRRGRDQDPGCCRPVTAGGSGNWDGTFHHRGHGVKAVFPLFTQVSLFLLLCSWGLELWRSYSYR